MFSPPHPPPSFLSFSLFGYEIEKTFVIFQATFCLPWCAVPPLASCEGTSLKQALRAITSEPLQNMCKKPSVCLLVDTPLGALAWDPWLGSWLIIKSCHIPAFHCVLEHHPGTWGCLLLFYGQY